MKQKCHWQRFLMFVCSPRKMTLLLRPCSRNHSQGHRLRRPGPRVLGHRGRYGPRRLRHLSRAGQLFPQPERLRGRLSGAGLPPAQVPLSHNLRRAVRHPLLCQQQRHCHVTVRVAHRQQDAVGLADEGRCCRRLYSGCDLCVASLSLFFHSPLFLFFFCSSFLHDPFLPFSFLLSRLCFLSPDIYLHIDGVLLSLHLFLSSSYSPPFLHAAVGAKERRKTN